MMINPSTGKGWTDAEEAEIARIMAEEPRTRIEAIQLMRRRITGLIRTSETTSSDVPRQHVFKPGRPRKYKSEAAARQGVARRVREHRQRQKVVEGV